MKTYYVTFENNENGKIRGAFFEKSESTGDYLVCEIIDANDVSVIVDVFKSKFSVDEIKLLD